MSVKTSPQSSRGAHWCKSIALVVFAFVVLFLRRPDQFLHPYVWAEDGAINFPDFVATGWKSILHPVAGYYILPMKLIHAAAMATSFRWYPEISSLLTCAFSACVLLAVALSPTSLRYRYLCAATVLLVPTDPEVFAVALYAGWWGSILALLPLMWRADAGSQCWRMAFLTIGALSSPLIIALTPLYALRALRSRCRNDAIVLAACITFAGLQAWSLSHSAGGVPPAGNIAIDPLQFVNKFFGYFVFWDYRYPSPYLYLSLGLLLLGTIAAALWRGRHELPPAIWWLLAMLSCASLISVLRIPVTAIHPVLAGPRYFFLPDLLLSWILLQLFSLPSIAYRIALVALSMLVALNLVLHGSRRHDSVDWRAEITTCIGEEVHRFPVHLAGNRYATWSVDVNGADCRRLVEGSLIDNEIDRETNMSPPSVQ